MTSIYAHGVFQSRIASAENRIGHLTIGNIQAASQIMALISDLYDLLSNPALTPDEHAQVFDLLKSGRQDAANQQSEVAFGQMIAYLKTFDDLRQFDIRLGALLARDPNENQAGRRRPQS